MELKLCDVACGYGTKEVLRNVNLSFKTGEFACVLGANGIGKTTLFKTILGSIREISGEINIDGKSTCSMGSKELAKYISYVPQAKNYSYQYTVMDTVLMGRAIHIGKFSAPSKNDTQVAEIMLKRLGIEHLKNNMYSALSGGEQQVVLVARALAQEAKFIVMDEPASNLDFENQKRVLDTLKYLAQKNFGIIMSSHSPDHALYCNSRVVLIRKDKTIHCGSTTETLTEKNLREVYGVDISIIRGESPSGIELCSCCLTR